MNNFYGVIKNQLFSSNTNEYETPIGVWASHKLRNNIEKDAKLLKNRVNLLEEEDKKLNQKIKITQQKMQEYLLKKHEDYIYYSEKQKHKELKEAMLAKKREINYSSQNVRKHFRRSIHDAISIMRKSESQEIKKFRDQSLQIVENSKRELLFKKKIIANQIKQEHIKGQTNIQTYWDNKKKFYLESHKKDKEYNELEAKNKEKEILELEKKEEMLIKKLENSQRVDENNIKLLEDIIETPLEEFEKKFEKKIKQSRNAKKI